MQAQVKTIAEFSP